MTPTEILDKRIATATRRYTAALEGAALRIKHELTDLQENSPTYEPGSISIFAEVIRTNGELAALLTLKDQIENQARTTVTAIDPNLALTKAIATPTHGDR